jgi:hypothetical protein
LARTNSFTELQPVLMSMLISMVFSFIIISPLSTVAIAIAILGIIILTPPKKIEIGTPALLTWLVPINNTASVAAIPVTTCFNEYADFDGI